MVMMSNVIDAMASDESVPCSMSKKVIESLRTDLGFEGIGLKHLQKNYLVQIPLKVETNKFYQKVMI